MSQTLTVHLSRPIKSVKILEQHFQPPTGGGAFDSEENISAADVRAGLMEDLEKQKAEAVQVCRLLRGVIEKLNQFCDNLVSEHKEEIAKLSVEIARKILMQKVEEGDYEIERIVNEALKNAPTHQDVVVHLNPEDLVQCQKAQQDEPGGALSGIKFVPNMGRAECLLETGKGIVKSLIDEHLELIGKALKKAK
jgi:flagellar biosynthesis/type III secretory pathway protein FliH